MPRVPAARTVVVRAPTRIDFGGGWTDVPPYSEREGGAVCNVAITRYAVAHVSVGNEPAGRDPQDAGPEDALVAAAIRRSAHPQLRVTLESDFPIGAGLGGSSAAGVAIACGLARLGGTTPTRAALALESRAMEVGEMGMPGGFQDHFAAAFGGALMLTFGGSEPVVEPLPVSPAFRAGLSKRGILIYTGKSRISGSTIIAVRDAYEARNQRVRHALEQMKILARQMANAIRASDLDTLGALLTEHWKYQADLHPSITTPRIEQIVTVAARCGALGAKALGASGGGCVIAIAARDREDELARALAPLGQQLGFDIDTDGVTVMSDSGLTTMPA